MQEHRLTNRRLGKRGLYLLSWVGVRNTPTPPRLLVLLLTSSLLGCAAQTRLDPKTKLEIKPTVGDSSQNPTIEHSPGASMSGGNRITSDSWTSILLAVGQIAGLVIGGGIVFFVLYLVARGLRLKITGPRKEVANEVVDEPKELST